jgi:hypothetical protein
VAYAAPLRGTAERRALAVCFVVAIVAREAFGFIQTAERLITGREALQAPLRSIQEAHAKAIRRVDEAAATSFAMPTTSKTVARG